MLFSKSKTQKASLMTNPFKVTKFGSQLELPEINQNTRLNVTKEGKLWRMKFVIENNSDNDFTLYTNADLSYVSF